MGTEPFLDRFWTVSGPFNPELDRFWTVSGPSLDCLRNAKRAPGDLRRTTHSDSVITHAHTSLHPFIYPTRLWLREHGCTYHQGALPVSLARVPQCARLDQAVAGEGPVQAVRQPAGGRGGHQKPSLLRRHRLEQAGQQAMQTTHQEIGQMLVLVSHQHVVLFVDDGAMDPRTSCRGCLPSRAWTTLALSKITRIWDRWYAGLACCHSSEIQPATPSSHCVPKGNCQPIVRMWSCMFRVYLLEHAYQLDVEEQRQFSDFDDFDVSRGIY
eukprot:1196181-Prorocentrum_minimum.AAC.6